MARAFACPLYSATAHGFSLFAPRQRWRPARRSLVRAGGVDFSPRFTWALTRAAGEQVRDQVLERMAEKDRSIAAMITLFDKALSS